MNVLTPAQREFLARFFARARAQKFYLTGGSALAEFYLGHRFSQDMDLFTQDKQAWQAIEEDVRFAVESVGGTLDFRAAKPQDELHRAIIRVAHEPELKVDIVRDAPPHFGEPEVQNDGVIVDSLENIAVGKLLALYGRAYPRDFVDVFFLLENGWNFRRLIELGKEKDPGLIEFYLAGMLRDASRIRERQLPVLLKPLDLEQMKSRFLQLANDISKTEEANG